MVVGGDLQSHTSDIFDLDSDGTWTPGPAAPEGGIYGAASVQLTETTFMVVGGADGTHYLDTIYEFNPDSWTWKLRSERLENAKCDFVALPIPDELLKC